MRARRLIAQLFGLAIMMGALGATPAVADELVAPWEIIVGKIEKLPEKKKCAPHPAPVTRLLTETIYEADDASRTEIDPEAQTKYLEEIEPVRKYLRGVVSLANGFAISHGKNRVAGQCAVRAIAEWARAGALLDAETQIAMFNRATFLSGVASAYIQIKQSPELAADDRSVIEDWLSQLSAKTREFYSRKRQSATVAPNNIQYWGSLGVAMAAIATGDRQSLDWAVEAVALGACQATPEGALPRELARKQRARHYHLFAIAPLVTLAELAERNGMQGYEACSGALHRIISFALGSVDDAGLIEELSGSTQLAMGSLKSATDLAWLEFYAARFPARAWKLVKIRPLSNSYLGGNLTALLGQGSP